MKLSNDDEQVDVKKVVFHGLNVAGVVVRSNERDLVTGKPVDRGEVARHQQIASRRASRPS